MRRQHQDPGTNPFFGLLRIANSKFHTILQGPEYVFFMGIVNHRDISFLKVIEQTIQLIQLHRFGTPVPI